MLGDLRTAGSSLHAAAETAERLLQCAIEREATDLHFQPVQSGYLVRYRVDGTLEDGDPLPFELGKKIVNTLKVRGGMDVTDAGRPQDGRLTYPFAQRAVDLRLASTPSAYGEKLSLRILDCRRDRLGLKELGLNPQELPLVEQLIHRPQGLVLVTGPTGAGKTTSLYAMLSALNDASRHIVTVEDPIEYDIPRVLQIGVDPARGLGFSELLRAVFRHDPDVLMVGEIRDRESAQIAVRAALSGHLVFSTLHCGSALGAYSTLSHLGVNSYLAASALVGVVTQQLIRKTCSVCKEERTFNREVLSAAVSPQEERRFPESARLAVGRGCESCRQTGYRGRTGVFEILDIDGELRDALISRASGQRISNLARDRGWRNLREAAVGRALSGLTTLEEVLRVVPDFDEPDWSRGWEPESTPTVVLEENL